MESGTVWSEMTGTVWSEMGGTVWSVIATCQQIGHPFNIDGLSDTYLYKPYTPKGGQKTGS